MGITTSQNVHVVNVRLLQSHVLCERMIETLHMFERRVDSGTSGYRDSDFDRTRPL
jgi:hypothetical protein